MGVPIDKYVTLQQLANELRKHLVDLIMQTTNLSMDTRVALVKSLNVRVTNNNVVISSSLGEKFNVLNSGSRTFTKPFHWVEKAIDKSRVNFAPLINSILWGNIGEVRNVY